MSKDYVKEWSKVIKSTPPIIKNAVSEYDDEVSSLANSYGILIKENADLRAKLEAAIAVISKNIDLQDKFETVTYNHNVAEADLRDARNAIKELSAKLEAAENKMDKMREEFEPLEQALKQQETFNKNLRGKLLTAEKARDEARRQVAELTKFKHKYEAYVALQHGRNYDDDEAERKLNMLAEQHKKLQHEVDCMRLAVIASNVKDGSDPDCDYTYTYMPFDDNFLENLNGEVIVKIPNGWLQEMIEDKTKGLQAQVAILRGALELFRNINAKYGKHVMVQIETGDLKRIQQALSTTPAEAAERVQGLIDTLEYYAGYADIQKQMNHTVTVSEKVCGPKFIIERNFTANPSVAQEALRKYRGEVGE